MSFCLESILLLWEDVISVLIHTNLQLGFRWFNRQLDFHRKTGILRELVNALCSPRLYVNQDVWVCGYSRCAFSK